MPNSLESQRARTRAAAVAEQAGEAIMRQDYALAAQLLEDAAAMLAEIREREGSNA